MGAACSGLLSRRDHCVTQCATKPLSILTISSRAAKYGCVCGATHMRPPNAKPGGLLYQQEVAHHQVRLECPDRLPRDRYLLLQWKHSHP